MTLLNIPLGTMPHGKLQPIYNLSILDAGCLQKQHMRL